MSKVNTTRNIKSVSSPITKTLLKTVGLAGYAGVIIVAPNAVQAVEQLLKLSSKDKAPSRFKYYAKDSGYLKIDQVDDCKYAITLTNKGTKAVKDILFEEYVVPKPASWDGMWRILSFDISEQDRKLRDSLRVAINRIGMKLIQNSVYVYPYPLDDFIKNIHSHYPQASRHLIQITATHVDGQDQLIKTFKKAGVI